MSPRTCHHGGSSIPGSRFSSKAARLKVEIILDRLDVARLSFIRDGLFLVTPSERGTPRDFPLLAVKWGVGWGGWRVSRWLETGTFEAKLPPSSKERQI